MDINQNVSTIIPIGPLVDPVSALPVSTFTLAASDAKQAVPANTTAGFNISAYLLSASVTASGFYYLHLSAGTVSILGQLHIQLTDNSLILPYQTLVDVVHSGYFNARYGSNTLEMFSALVTNAAGADLAADVAAVKAETALIVADTNELQSDDIPGSLTTILADTEAIRTDVTTILADTNELQTDWVNGGRLDVIVDAILVDTGTTLLADTEAIRTDVTTILADTNELQVDWTNGGRLDLIIDAILVDTGTTLLADTEAILADTEASGVSLTGITSAVWSAVLSDFTTAGTAGAALLSNFNKTTTLLTDTEAILADTNELQTDDIPGSLATLLTDTETILADTNELQGDWVNGGRLDLIVDAILVDTGTTLLADTEAIRTDVTTILADTNELQSDDIPASLATILTDTETLSAVAVSALQLYHLDHLLHTATPVNSIANSTVLALIAATNGTWSNFDESTDALQAIRDRGDAAWAGTVDINSFVSAIWSAALSDYTTAGTAGANLLSTFNDTVLVLADTNELQGDWVNGGRLDLLVDAILVDTGTTLLADTEAIRADATTILADTNELQSDDIPASLATILTDTETLSAVAVSALQLYHLDHLLHTAAPTNSIANSAVLALMAAIDGTWSTFDESTDALEAIRNRGDAAWAGTVDINSFVSAIWSATLSDYTLAGTAGANLLSTFNDTVLALADTNELQGDWVNGGRLDLIIDAILVDTGTTLLSDTEAILADTNELQTDWVNGGRLDLLVDAILADTEGFAATDVPSIVSGVWSAVLSDFTTAGTAGAAQLSTFNKTTTLLADTEAILADTNELQTDDIPGSLATLLTDTETILADTNELQTDNIPGSLATLLTDTEAIILSTATLLSDTEAILADTNELQTDDIPGSLATLLSDTEAILTDTNTSIPALIGVLSNIISTVDVNVNSVLVDTEAILVDTNELQVDWTNGGRLDLLVDAILVDTGTTLLADTEAMRTDVTSILADTNELQTDNIPGSLATLLTDTEAILADTGTDGVAIAAGAIDSAQFAAGAIDAAALAADAGTEIADAVWAKVLESEGSYTAQQAMQINLSILAGATNSGVSGWQFYTINSGTLRVSFGSISSDNERSAITANV